MSGQLDSVFSTRVMSKKCQQRVIPSWVQTVKTFVLFLVYGKVIVTFAEK